jgi:O-antigen biosynthesis protein
MKELPFISVIIVNYNGAHFLPNCLDALRSQTYAHDRYEVIVSDNGSTDYSVELLRLHYPWVNILENQSNLGFATGNNVAIKVARGEYFVLLNNDTAPHPEWLEKLGGVADENPRAGIITGHLHLFYDYITLQLQSDIYRPKNDGRELGVQIYDVDSGVMKGVVQYLEGCYGWERDTAGQKFRWTRTTATLGIPVPLTSGAFRIKLTLAAPRITELESVHCKASIEGSIVAEWTMNGKDAHDFELSISEEIRLLAKPFEQNTGSIVFYNGMGRDRGTYVKENEAFFEPDSGKYARVEEVFAGCGASLLIKRSLLAEVGGFDDAFFMYYEDTDLCWRARLLGWNVFYAPDAVVRHIHCGTTQEWSPLFIYLTERNRLAMILKNGSLRQVFRVWGSFFFRLLELSGKSLASILLFKAGWRSYASQLRVRTHVLIILLLWLPRLWKERFQTLKRQKVSFREIEAWFVK